MKHKAFLLAAVLLSALACAGCMNEDAEPEQSSQPPQPDAPIVEAEQSDMPDMSAVGSAVGEILNGGTDLTPEDEVALLKANRAAIGQEMTDEEAIYQIKRSHVIFAEAEKLGISTSLEDARRQLEDNWALVMAGLESDSEAERTSSEQVQEMMLQYIAGLGVTIEEYFDLAAPSMQRQLSANALLQHFISTLDAGVAADREQTEQLYNQYIDGLMAAAE